MNRKLLSLVVSLLLLVPALCCAQELSVILPGDYADSNQNYPVIYLLPQDGLHADDSGLCDKLLAAIQAQQGLEMIIVQPAFSEQDDPAAVLRSAIEQTDAQYRTVAAPRYRVLMGTGVGGYMAYALGLDMPQEIGAMISNEISPTINNYLGTTLWNEVYVDGVDTAEALEAAQDSIESDLF